MSGRVRRLLDLNTTLFFHTYLRGGDGRCAIGTLAWLDGWTLERKLDPTMGPACAWTEEQMEPTCFASQRRRAEAQPSPVAA